MIITIALYIILGIIALFVILLSVRVRVTIEMKDQLSLTVFAFGIKIPILPKKKKYRIKDYTPKKIAKREKKKAQKAAKKAKKDAEKQKKKESEKALSKEEKKALKQKEKDSRPPLGDMIDLFLRILKMFFSGFFAKFHFHVARIRIGVGSANAAMTAMLACAIQTAIKPVLMLIDKKSNLHGMKNADILIYPDYLSDKITADVKLSFSMSAGALIGVLLKAGISFILGWGKIKPAPLKPSDGNSKPENKESKTESISA